ncbi:COMM domain-containing protein 3 isoform X4 [Choloepus didactylus]|uniref:COMM domain-containing protein 3 isoform X4 n=1 Tax=Choloepus didactylus TaxID=27675 RepID=UPI00189C625E|nr:COMM domain-containing protein 3 isoform X4 [Choloepus didactylus]
MRFRAAPARRAEPRAGPGSWASASPRARRRTPSPFPTRTWGLRGARGARRAGRAEGLRGWASGTQSARLGSAGPAPLPRRPPEPCAHPRPPSARRASRGARVEGHSARTMELSESVQKGFQLLADPGAFGPGAFALVLRAAFQSLLGAQADGAVLGPPPAPRAASAGLAKVEPGLFAKRLLGQMALTLPDIQSTPRSQDRPNTSRGASTPGTLKWDALRFVPHRRLLSVVSCTEI